MALERDLSNLPRDSGGLTPDDQPRFVQLLAELWMLDNAAQGDRPTAIEGTRFRFSDAAKCARAVAYKGAGIERTNPMDLSGVWNTRLGTMIHDAWQEAMAIVYPDCNVEVQVALDGLDGSGHGDATVLISLTKTTGKVIVIELKSIGGYGFKASVGKMGRNKPAEGPRTEHIVQGALAAKAQNADELVIGYLAKESLSVNVGAGLPEASRFCAEWTFTREQYEPLADAEIKRVTGILGLLDDGLLAARKVPFDMPPAAEIVDVAASRWEQKGDDGTVLDTGTLWNGSFCKYCGWFDLCASTSPGRIPLESVVTIGKRVA